MVFKKFFLVGCFALLSAAPAIAQLTPTLGKSVDADGHVVNNGAVECKVGCSSASPITPTKTTAAASCLQAKATSGSLSGVTMQSTVAGWFLFINTATASPADGAVTPIDFVRYPTADVTFGYAANPAVAFDTGMSICFSTTGPYTLTKSATANISAKVL